MAISELMYLGAWSMEIGEPSIYKRRMIHAEECVWTCLICSIGRQELKAGGQCLSVAETGERQSPISR